MATININMNESLNNKFIDAIPYEESVLSYNAVLTHNEQLLKLAIERIITNRGTGKCEPVDGKAFIHTDMNGKVSVYELQSFGDTIAIHDKDNGYIIMLCDYADGLVDACEGIDIPTTLVARPKIEEDDEPIAAPIVAPAIRSNRRRNAQPVEEPTTEQPAPVAEAPLSLQGEGRGESLTYDLTIALHANKQGECKTYYVHGKGYKSIPKAVLDKWYPAGKGKASKAHSAFWSKARFEANGGIDALRKELPDMNIEFIDTIEQPATEQPTEQPTQPANDTKGSLPITGEGRGEGLISPTEDGSAPATFPEEEKPTKKSDKPAVSPMVKQFFDLKAKHPDALLLFRCGDFYETYCEDAEKAAKVLGITLTKSSKQKDEKGKPLAMAGFPYHALDTYLPKLIRAGHRVAICDQIEAPKAEKPKTITPINEPKFKPTEVVKPAKVEQPKAEPIQAPADKENGDGSTCGEIVKFSDEMTANIKKFGKHVMGKGTMTFDFNGKDRVNVYIQVDDKHKKMLTEVMEHETKKKIMLVGGISPFLKELAEWDGYLNIENIA